MGHFKMVTALLAAVTLVDLFQVMLGTGSMCSLGWEPVTLPGVSLWTERGQTRQ